jgi:hypothetical protein
MLTITLCDYAGQVSQQPPIVQWKILQPSHIGGPMAIVTILHRPVDIVQIALAVYITCLFW